MTVALNTMLPTLAKITGAWLGSFSTTTTIAASTALVSTALRNAGYTDDSVLEDTFVRIKGTANDEVIRRVESYTASTGSITVSGENLAAESGAVTFELYTRNPQELIDALNTARITMFPARHQKIWNRDLTGGYNQHRWDLPSGVAYVTKVFTERRIEAKTYEQNVLGTLDCDCEGDLSDWTAATATIAVQDETTGPDNFVVFAGQQSAKVSVSAGTGQVYLTVPSPTGYVGKKLNFSVWVYADTLGASDSVKAAIRTDGGSWTLGDAHSGKGWQKLTVSLTDHSISTSINVGLQVTGAAALVVYMDEAILVAGPSMSPGVDACPVLEWYKEGTELFIPALIRDYETILIEAIAPLSSVSDGADEMELTEEQGIGLYNMAASLLKASEFDEADPDELNAAQRTETHWRNRADERSMALPSVRRTPVA